jgi:hypothetical protein
MEHPQVRHDKLEVVWAEKAQQIVGFPLTGQFRPPICSLMRIQGMSICAKLHTDGIDGGLSASAEEA